MLAASARVDEALVNVGVVLTPSSLVFGYERAPEVDPMAPTVGPLLLRLPLVTSGGGAEVVQRADMHGT